ncbi:SDR family NAD(P)-dependent oxidoreductase [Streptomyces syringium]|uniref:Shikimate 5-dehydrogenase n=1 Tax=Streptomyces syringium TaxID=76729 RepID=A0ABS4XVY4_9ACTN|nr:SDR family NAD(P)-dependent oxidoreductase [Streptomyces syringium]MBP2400667.1 shikimate 5-dehydrogenase [Streptomyces syringium]
MPHPYTGEAVAIGPTWRRPVPPGRVAAVPGPGQGLPILRRNPHADGKRILITGAGSGFGRSASLRLAERDHHVIAATENRPQMTGLIDETKKQQAAVRGLRR